MDFKSIIPDTSFLKEEKIKDLISFLESQHRTQEIVSKKRHRTIVFITICSLCLTILGLLFQGYIHLNNQSDIQETRQQQKTIDIERNELLKLHLLRLDGLVNEQAKQDSLNKKY